MLNKLKLNQKGKAMTAALDVVEQAFKACEWDYKREDEAILTRINGGHGQILLVVTASDEEKWCLVTSTGPLKCPEKARKRCSELMARINGKLVLGAFYINFDTGAIHFRTSVPFAEGRLELEVVNALVGCNLAMMERFLPPLTTVSYSGAAPSRVAATIDKEEEAKRTPEPEIQGRLFLN